MNINKFYINKSESVINQTRILKDYIDKKVKTNNFENLIRIISNTFGIPSEKVEFEIKKNLAENHNFRIGKFSKKFGEFRKISKNFGKFRKILEKLGKKFGKIQKISKNFGQFRRISENFQKKKRKISKNFEKIRKNSENFKKFRKMS